MIFVQPILDNFVTTTFPLCLLNKNNREKEEER